MMWPSVPLKYMEHYPYCAQGLCHSFIAGLQHSGIAADCFLSWKKEILVEHVSVPGVEYGITKSTVIKVS